VDVSFDTFEETETHRQRDSLHQRSRSRPYWTPPEAVIALMKIEPLPWVVYDPCCGSGAILDVLRAKGHTVFGSGHGHGWPDTVVRDYFAEPVEDGVAIVTNPPYAKALQFIKKAIADGCPYHAWLLRLNFLESQTRKTFFESFLRRGYGLRHAVFR
jgi:hypothetical protein